MKKPTLPKRSAKQPVQGRITNETVAEHRERILAGGRRYKYPMQYARHKLVINAIILGVVALLIAAIAIWQQLYVAQNTSDFFYRITKTIPLPVASVDGKMVPYSNYLLYFKGSAYYLQRNEQVNFNSDNGKQQLDHIKRKSLDGAESDTYASKLAGELNISVSEEEVTKVIDQTRASFDNASQEAYNASALSILGWSADEYRSVIKQKLLRLKVAYAIDDTANNLQKKAAEAIAANPDVDFDALAKQLDPTGRQVGTGASGTVPLTNSDGGLSSAAVRLEPGKTSGAVKNTSGDGYYFVRLISKNNSQLSYNYIKISLAAFDDQLTKLRDQSKIKEYIKVSADR